MENISLDKNTTKFMEILGYAINNELLVLMADCKKEVDNIRPILDKWRDCRKNSPIILADKSDIVSVNEYISNLKNKISLFDSFINDEKNDEKNEEMIKVAVAHSCNLKNFITDTENLVRAIVRGGIVVDR